MKRFYTAEPVTEGHPDKFCNLIADSVPDDCLKGDSASRVACEVVPQRAGLLWQERLPADGILTCLLYHGRIFRIIIFQVHKDLCAVQYVDTWLDVRFFH